MSIGSPIVISETPKGRQFKLLTAISTGNDDPNLFKEKLLQELIAKSPHVLPISEFLDSKPQALFSLGQEVTVDIGDSQGRIDNLLVTNDGYLVIVETKLHRNREATRAVVAQTLQYGMAVGRMSLPQLEDCIRGGQNPALKHNESIHECVSRLAATDQRSSVPLVDNFEETLGRHLRQGEILLLVVTDGVHVGVERLTQWLNKNGSSSPFKFGLVELKLYAIGDQRLVVPRAIMKTLEVSRHIVVVDIKPSTEVNLTSRVTDDFRNTFGGKVQESRQVNADSVPLTRNALLQLLISEDRQAASQLVEQLEIRGFDQQGTASTLKFGFMSDGEFHLLVTLDKSGAWAGMLKKDRERLGAEAMLSFRRDSNKFGRFYREDQMDTGCAVKYRQLEDSAPDFAAFLDSYRYKLIELMESME